MSRMYDKIERGELALGTIMLGHGTETVETLGYAGLDFICFDMMVTPLDWSEVAEMTRAVERYRVTPWVRIPAYPWGGADGTAEFDRSLPATVLRALALGAECVLAAVNSADEVKRLLDPLTNPHRRFFMLQSGPDRSEEQLALTDSLGPQNVVPIIESLDGIRTAEEMLSVEGLSLVYLGMGDICRQLGHPGDEQHPEVQKVISDVVEMARSHGLKVGANTLGYKPGSDLATEMVEGARYFYELGVSAVILPRPTMVLQRFFETTLARIDMAIRNAG